MFQVTIFKKMDISIKYYYRCKSDTRQQKNKGDNKNYDVVIANADLFITCDENVINPIHDESRYVVDSDSTSHFMNKEELFSSCTLSNFEMLKIRKKDEVEVLGIGTVCLHWKKLFEILSQQRESML